MSETAIWSMSTNGSVPTSILKIDCFDPIHVISLWMSLDRLAALTEVARRGSITDAARAIGLTQPAVTRRLQLLEEEFGALLMERGRKGVVLTEIGRLVEREGRALLDRYERIKEDVGARLRLETGTVRAGGGATAVSAVLPGAIREFNQRHPEVVFELTEAGSRAIALAVSREELELGVVTLPVRDEELDVAPLRRDRIVLVAARDHPLARRKRIPAAALQGLPLVGFEAGSAIRRLIDRALEKEEVEMRVVMELRSIQSILNMVGLDLGLGFVSALGVDPADRKIRVLPVTGLRVERTLAVVTKRGRPLSVAAGAFLKQLDRSR